MSGRAAWLAWCRRPICGLLWRPAGAVGGARSAIDEAANRRLLRRPYPTPFHDKPYLLHLGLQVRRGGAGRGAIHTVAWQRAGDRAEGSRAWRSSWPQVMCATVPLLAAEPPTRARTAPLPPQAYDRGFLRRYCAMAPTPLQVCECVAGLGKVGGRLRGRLRQPPAAVAPRRAVLLSPHPPVFKPCAPPPQMMEDLEQLKVLENGYRMKVGGLALGPQGWGAVSALMMACWEDGCRENLGRLRLGGGG